MKVHDHHPHKQHTIDFINSVVKNSYYKENRTLQLVLLFSVAFANMLFDYVSRNLQFQGKV